MVVQNAEKSGCFLVEMIEMVSGFNRSVSNHFGRRSLSFSSLRLGSHYKAWMSRYFQVLVLSCSLISFILAIACGYLYAYPSLNLIIHDSDSLETTEPVDEKCDLFDGNWIPDSSYPLYNASECPFAERGFNCLANGRKDRDYLKWRWKPKNCELPKFDVQRILKWLRGKRVVFVGDSMSRTQWESMICMLMTGVEDKRGVYEINGNKITKQIRFLGVYFTSYNFTVEFFRSVFLVQHGWASRHSPKRVKSTLKLDKLDDISKEWSDSDILIFNSGHWWSPGKLFETGCYFQVGGALKLGMPITTAFRTALDTWASWVETRVNTNKTRVFFRSFEPSHWSDQGRRFCKVPRHPMSNTKGKEKSPLSDVISNVVKNMKVPVTVLQVSYMGAFRSDAHVGTWSDMPSVPDCSHWCLPGVPDFWNEIVFSYVLAYDGLSTQSITRSSLATLPIQGKETAFKMNHVSKNASFFLLAICLFMSFCG